jgi:hypothetical protein
MEERLHGPTQVLLRQLDLFHAQRGTATGRQDEPIPIEPLRIGRIMPEKSGPQHVGRGRGAQRQARVATVGLLHGVDRQETDCIDGQLIQLRGIESCRY